MQKIDFSALEKPPSANTPGLGDYLGVGFGGLVIVAVLSLLSIWLFVPAAGLWFYLLIKLFSQSHTESTQQLEEFKQSNGWNAGEVIALDPGLPDLNYRIEPSMLHGQLDGHRFWLYLAVPQLQTDNANVLTLLTVETQHALPRLLLFPAWGWLTPIISRMARNNFGLSPLRLEGNFNEHVQVYHIEGEQIDTLSYLTPDVMAVVEDKVKDVVLYNDHTFSVSTSAPIVGNAQGIRKLFEAAQVLIKEIDEKA